jgi:hypothetical protein
MKFANTKTAAVAAAFTLCVSAATAAPPARVVGTWSLTTNQTFGQLIVTAQGSANLPDPCKVILGTVSGAYMNGWYCPATGRIHFYHKNTDSRVPIKVYDGYVADEEVGSPQRMSGTYVSEYPSIQPYGDYPFSATK